MASLNVNFQGRLGGDIKTLENGSIVFSVAVDNHDKNKTTTWISCFIGQENKLPYERATKFLKKGSGVYIQGGLRLNIYTNKDNQQIPSLQCNVADFDFSLSSGKKEEDGNGTTDEPVASYTKPAPSQTVTAQPTTSQPTTSQLRQKQVVSIEQDTTSDLPF